MTYRCPANDISLPDDIAKALPQLAPPWQPTQYASGYSLDLYCDRSVGNWMHDSSFPRTYIGETFSECAKQARADGWIIHTKTRTATCPRCARKRKK